MSYIEAKEKYAKYGIDTEKALETLKNVSISVHCWQGDDVVGFDSKEALSGGIQATGNYPGRARTPEELMADYDKAFSLIGGKKKLSTLLFRHQDAERKCLGQFGVGIRTGGKSTVGHRLLPDRQNAREVWWK